jgi:putative transposase
MNLSNNLVSHYRSLGYESEALSFVQRVREAPPSRRVGGTRFLTVASHFPSMKMGCTIQAESRLGELPLVHRFELDDDVLEYYDQPTSVSVSTIRNGRRQLSNYTPDFLVLRRTSVEVVEVRPATWIQNSQKKHPDDWNQTNGRPVYLPYATPFHRIGIDFYVHRNEDIARVEAANLVLLAAAKAAHDEDPRNLSLKKAIAFLRRNVATSLYDLAQELGYEVACIANWIARGQLFVAIEHQLLADTRTTRVFTDRRTRDAFANALAESQKWARNGEERCLALNDNQLEIALARYRRAQDALSGARTTGRTERRILAAIKGAQASGANPLYACAPKFSLRGNRQRRLREAQLALMDSAIDEYYCTPASRPAKWVYRAIDWHGEVPASYVSFLKQIKRRARSDLMRNRIGHRAMRAHEPPSDPRLRAVGPTTAWELVHIDHTPLDEKVWGSLGPADVLGRPWITTMVDHWSGAILAFWMSFSPPSSQSLAMVLRDCVRRHRRLPIAWMSDQGSDFVGTYWETFAAAYGCTKSDRPTAAARYGAQVEQKFHSLHQDLIYALDGNMQNDKHARASVATHKSNATARYTLARLHTYIEQYYFSQYNALPHGTRTFSPDELLADAAREIGSLTRVVAYDFTFLVDTALRPKAKHHKLDTRRGIRVNQTSFWNELLGAPDLDGTRVEVRLEPFDSTKIYAFVRNRWIECYAAGYQSAATLDEISRWAQTMIDTHGWSMARAARRFADERFAREQRARHDVDDPSPALRRRSEQVVVGPTDVEPDHFAETRLLDIGPLESA